MFSNGTDNMSVNIPIVIQLLVMLASLYPIHLAIYRIWFHPLKRFPGPRLAASTYLYEFYFNIVKNGQFLWQIKKLHEVYGPIVRITPDELHIQDPEYYKEIYARGSRIRDKDARSVKQFAADHALVAITDHHKHRFRRRLLGEYFSIISINNVEPVIKSHIEKLISHLEKAANDHSVVSLSAASAALTVDTISQYIYGESCNFLDRENFNEKWSTELERRIAGGVLVRQFPWLLSFLKLLDLRILRKTTPGVEEIVKLERLGRQMTFNCLENSGEKSEVKSIFSALNDPTLPLEERTVDAMVDEGHILLLAGTETTAKTFSTVLFYISDNRDIYVRLRNELAAAFPDPLTPLSWTALTKLPYLAAVVNESLRLTSNITSRLPRVAPNEVLHYGDYDIPPGTPLSHISYFTHMKPVIFPNPELFQPERWIRASDKGQQLERYIVAFTKGSRQCIGINLSKVELLLTIASLVRRFDFDLY